MADKPTETQKKKNAHLWSEAESLFIEAEEQDGGYNEDKLNEVLSILDSILKTDSKNDRVLSNIGAVKSVLGDHEGAIKDFDQAITLRLDSKDFETWFNRGIAKGKSGRHEEAIKDFDQVLNLDPNNANTWFNRGLVNNALDRHEEATKDFDHIFKLIPATDVEAQVWFHRGVSNGGSGCYEESIKDFNKAISLNRNDAEAWFNRGIAKSRLGHHKAAIEDCNEALDLGLAPDIAAQAWVNCGLAKVRLGRPEDAIEDFTKAISVDPNNAAAWGARGHMKVVLKEFSEAIPDLDKAITKGYDVSFIWNDRGVAKNKVGRYVEALTDFSIARNSNPGNIEAHDNYVKMQLAIKGFLPDAETHNDHQAPAGWSWNPCTWLAQLFQVKCFSVLKCFLYYGILSGFALAYIGNEKHRFIEIKSQISIVGLGVYLMLWLVPFYGSGLGAWLKDVLSLIRKVKVGSVDIELNSNKKPDFFQGSIRVNYLESMKRKLKPSK